MRDERLNEIVKRPGQLAKVKKEAKFLHRARKQKVSSDRLQQAVGRSPLFPKELWSQVASSTIKAIHDILEVKDPSKRRKVRRAALRRYPISSKQASNAQELLNKLVSFLDEVATQKVVAQLILDENHSLRAELTEEMRRAIDERQGAERDTVIYPGSHLFSDTVVRLR